MKKRYAVKVLQQVAPQEYKSIVIYRTDDPEVAEAVAFEQGGYVDVLNYKEEDQI